MLPADRPAPSTTPGARAGDPQRRRADDEAAEGGERRKSGRRRRASDRLFDRATRSYPQTEALSQVRNLENLILFIDDDLRETALGLRHIGLEHTGALLEGSELQEQLRRTVGSGR